jgi:hypothetical protein
MITKVVCPSPSTAIVAERVDSVEILRPMLNVRDVWVSATFEIQSQSTGSVMLAESNSMGMLVLIGTIAS